MRRKEESYRFPSILVLVAALDEQEGIRLTLAELKHYLPCSTLLVVDGNSSDETVHAAKSQGADVIFQKGEGKGDAISCGLESVNSEFDYVVFIDADYTYPAERLQQMIEILEANPEIGMVCGNRFNAHMTKDLMPAAFNFGNRMLSFVHNFFNGVSLQDPLTGLRVVRWNILKNWRPASKGFDVEVELNHHVERQGYDIKEIDILFRKRVGEKKLKARHGLSIMKRILIEIAA